MRDNLIKDRTKQRSRRHKQRDARFENSPFKPRYSGPVQVFGVDVQDRNDPENADYNIPINTALAQIQPLSKAMNVQYSRCKDARER